jgi:hypothetical protein
MQSLVKILTLRFPELTFRAGQHFYWSPENQEIVYSETTREKNKTAAWSLLHETSHALLGHKNYQNDFQLVSMEVEAWERAKQLTHELALDEIDENHVQDCLDTYRDWLHKRCLCPNCETRSFQTTAEQYSCHNCGAQWHVTPSRFCRAYRLGTKDTVRI